LVWVLAAPDILAQQLIDDVDAVLARSHLAGRPIGNDNALAPEPLSDGRHVTGVVDDYL